MLTFICYAKCSTCRKAKAFLNEIGSDYIVRDIKADNPTSDEYCQGVLCPMSK